MIENIGFLFYLKLLIKKLEPCNNSVRKIYAKGPVNLGIAHICCRALRGRVD